MEYIKIDTSRNAYSPKDIAGETMTAGEMIDVLSDYDEDTPVLFAFDDGYMYGVAQEYMFDIDYCD